MNTMLSAVLFASNNGGGDLIHGLLYLVIIGVVLGIIYWLINAAPFLPEIFKKVLGWLIIVIGALIIINFLLSIVGHPLFQI